MDFNSKTEQSVALGEVNIDVLPPFPDQEEETCAVDPVELTFSTVDSQDQYQLIGRFLPTLPRTAWLVRPPERPWHRADQAEWEWDCRPDTLFRLLADEFSPFRLCLALCRGECEWSTISLKKAGLVHDSIEKI